MAERTNTYFLSDAHLGSLLQPHPHEQERRICRMLDTMATDATAIYLMGDMIDFWYEYRYVVPKGFVRFMGKIAELTDRGIEVHFFVGNHDQWDFGYMEHELGVRLHTSPERICLNGKQCYLAHGDGLNVNRQDERAMNSIFHNRLLRHLFRGLHPTAGMWFGQHWSRNNRRKELAQQTTDSIQPEQERLVRFAIAHEQHQHADYYIFGHRHIMLDYPISSESRIIILGDLINYYSYARLTPDGQLELLTDTSGTILASNDTQ